MNYARVRRDSGSLYISSLGGGEASYARSGSVHRSRSLKDSSKSLQSVGVNSRMDRLTREMAEVSKATETGDPKRAGYSLGITRKTIEKRKPLRNELNGIEGLPVRKRQKRSQHSSTSSPTGGPGRRKGWREPASQETVGYTSREAPHDSGYSEHLHSSFSKSHSQFSDAPFDSPSYYAKLRFPSETNSDMLPFVREVDEEYMNRSSQEQRSQSPPIPSWLVDRLLQINERPASPARRLPNTSSLPDSRHISSPSSYPPFAVSRQENTESRSSSITAYQPESPSPSLRPRPHSFGPASYWDHKTPATTVFPSQVFQDDQPSPVSKPFDSSIFELNLYARQISSSPSLQAIHPSATVDFSSPTPVRTVQERSPSPDDGFIDQTHNPVPLFEEAARLRSPSDFMMSRSSLPSAAPANQFPRQGHLAGFEFQHPLVRSLEVSQTQDYPTFEFSTPEQNDMSKFTNTNELLTDRATPAYFWKQPPQTSSPTFAAQAREIRLQESKKHFEVELFKAAEESFDSWKTLRSPHHSFFTDTHKSLEVSPSRTGVEPACITPSPPRPFFLKPPPVPIFRQRPPPLFSPLAATSHQLHLLPSDSSSSSSSFLPAPNDENLPPNRETSHSDVKAVVEENTSPLNASSPAALSPPDSDSILRGSSDEGATIEELNGGEKVAKTGSEGGSDRKKRSIPDSNKPPDAAPVTRNSLERSSNSAHSKSNGKVPVTPLPKPANSKVVDDNTVEARQTRARGSWNPIEKAGTAGKILRGMVERDAKRGGGRKAGADSKGRGGELEDDPIVMD